MIEKKEITTMASKLGLNVETVQKDYVLGWMLWGINNDNELSNKWLFKGGTSLKKCFFDTFRFSEDLDFTVTDPKHFSVEFLKEKLIEITNIVYAEAGIEFFQEKFKFEILSKTNDKLSAQGTIHYNSLLKSKPSSSPRIASIKIDLTNDEIVVLQPKTKRVHHPYSDEASGGIWASCYSFEEVIAEKIRALGQRARPRDLYDIIHFFRNRNLISNPQLVYNLLTKKCSYKKIAIPNFSSIKNHEKMPELNSEWHNMLAHQLPSLPPLNSFWIDLEPFFEWLTGALHEQHLVSPSEIDGEVFQPDRISSAYSINAVVHKIQFAAANRVRIELTYHHKNRIIEPLSFRKAKSGRRFFVGYEVESGHPKSFDLLKIQGVTITNTAYQEREYPVEINASSHVVMPPIRKNN